jgi:hypothetical protein
MQSTSTRSKRLRWSWLGWPVLAVIVLAAGVYFGGRSGTDPERYTNDFNVYYHAAREIVAGHDPYDDSLTEWTPYLYPPLLAELLIPIASLPLGIASYFWFVINCFSLILAARLVAIMLVGRPLGDVAVGVSQGRSGDDFIFGSRTIVATGALILVFRFALDSFSLGQVNPVIASLAVAHVYLFDRGRKVSSATALVLAASIKLSPLVLIGYHLIKRRFKFAVSCGLLFLFANALSFAVLGGSAPRAVETFLNRTVRNRQGYDLAYAGNQSLRGAVARIELSLVAAKSSNPADRSVGASSNTDSSGTASDASREPTSVTTILITLALLGLAGMTSLRSTDEPKAAAPFVCLMVLLSPLAWKAHFVAMLLPAGVMMKHLIVTYGNGYRRIYPTLSVIVFSLWNMTSPNVIGLKAAEWADAHSLVFAGGVLLCAVVMMTPSDAPSRMLSRSN